MTRTHTPAPCAQVMRESGEAIGYVDYVTREDMDRAIRRLDDTEFRNPFDKAYVRVKEIGRWGRRAAIVCGCMAWPVGAWGFWVLCTPAFASLGARAPGKKRPFATCDKRKVVCLN